MGVLGETVIANFAKKHPNARKPLQRFLELVRAASWSNTQEVRRTFQDADFLPTDLRYRRQQFPRDRAGKFREANPPCPIRLDTQEYDRERL